jgi:hypothetical protein
MTPTEFKNNITKITTREKISNLDLIAKINTVTRYVAGQITTDEERITLLYNDIDFYIMTNHEYHLEIYLDSIILRITGRTLFPSIDNNLTHNNITEAIQINEINPSGALAIMFAHHSI